MTSGPSAPLRRFAAFLAAGTLFLIFAGGMVTSTGSGLAVPDWPLSYGQLFPPMVGGIFYEHGHRMIATAVGFLTLVLAFWLWRAEPRPWVKRLGYAAVGAVILQGLLGGLTVLLLLPTAVSVAHAGLAELFLCLTIALATVTSRGWTEAPPRRPYAEPGLSLGTMAAVTTGLIFVQILIGAVMRHSGAGLAIPDFPLSYGRLLPPSFAGGIAIHFAHRVGAVVVSLAILAVAVHVVRLHRNDAWLVRPTLLLLGLLAGQIVLGALTIWTVKSPVPTSLHVVGGAATLATSLALTLRAHRRFAPRSAGAAEPASETLPGALRA
jgi:cytochrome c oxidase assembly protein subunit 15